MTPSPTAVWPQVAFASDFNSEWNQMPLLLKYSKATGVGSLLDHTFVGMQKAMENPLFQVENRCGCAEESCVHREDSCYTSQT